jgi:integrase
MRKPRGHIRQHGTGYEVAVPVGQDPITKRYRYLYEQVATVEEAEAARDQLIAEVTAGREPRTKATFGELLDRMLEVADLDFTTRGMDQGYIERTIQPVLACRSASLSGARTCWTAFTRRCAAAAGCAAAAAA